MPPARSSRATRRRSSTSPTCGPSPARSARAIPTGSWCDRSRAMRPAARAAALLLGLVTMLELKAEPAGGARLEPVPFGALADWAEDDHAAAFSVFRRSCEAIVADAPALRPADPAGADLRAVCAAALALGDSPGR